MPQTFYIEADEEIISVIGRLRKSSAEENIFVFPKRALVLQSIVNLRLLQREAQKVGKKIVIVSQDEVGRMLAEKAGIAIENYSEDFSQKAAHLELISAAGAVPASASPKQGSREQSVPHSEAIGSSDFYALQSAPQAPAAPLTREASPATTLRIRNATPPKLTSLNSARLAEATTPVQREPVSRLGQYPASPSLSPLPPVSPVSSVPLAPIPSSFTASSPSTPQLERGDRLKNFYSGTRSLPPAAAAPNKAPKQQSVPVLGKKAHTIFFVLGGISILSLAGVLIFFFMPKAEVHVVPYKIIQPTDVELMGRADVSVPDDQAIPVRILEKDVAVTLTTATTGKSDGTNQKARGTVVIRNAYSADPQPLVATTRLETADGKLFRLVSGVTVPGMTTKDGAKEPGVIEANVVADQSGAEYNIDAAAFTIPGFKGGPKYGAFSAQSTKPMTGGGSGGTSDIAVVAKVDLDTAERDAKTKAKEDFMTAVRDELAPDERVLEEQMDIVLPAPITLPQVGTAANAIEYSATFKVRAFVFSEKSVQEKVDARSRKDVQGVAFKPVASSITYSDSVPNFSDGTLSLRAHALVTMESDIDRDKLRDKILGQNEDGIQQALGDFPEVKKISVTFRPQWFIHSIPTSQDRVFILVEPGEEGE
ncbi:MAG: hypothetical protein A2878_00495 [Candidatus Moranbacteria bacterium RIFCSPHIGHO2_01_FULL_54_31]|nr:MAG: hypothetical protein A2878_00495 [Candidatus Moranbacteria bacterium RIFCSPHIGHO2_01_FULL_54_31]